MNAKKMLLEVHLNKSHATLTNTDIYQYWYIKSSRKYDMK